MASLDFFRAVHNEEPDFFDEGPKTTTVKPPDDIGVFHNTSSIETSGIDGHRQGVELTLLKHFDAGTVKIHAGEPGHVLRRNRYGMDRYYRNNDPRFQEFDYFSPEQFMLAQDHDDVQSAIQSTFPIITNNNDQVENYIYNGAIEPFTIRSKVSFSSLSVLPAAHEVKGALMGGNIDSVTKASDKVDTTYYYDLKEQPPFIDQHIIAASFVDQAPSLNRVSVIDESFSNDRATSTPYVDVRLPRNTEISTNYSSELDAAISLMTGSTENYVNVAINKRSATSGWDYDNNTEVGTDSVSFGGMTY